jgi:hypothetical protein
LNIMADEETRELVISPKEDVTTPDASVPALTEAEQLAAWVAAVLDGVAARIPDLRAPDPESVRRVRGARTISRDFVASLISMVDTTPAVQALGTFNSDKNRTALQRRDGLRMISERLAILQATVNHTIEAQWADVVAEATATYRMASALAQSYHPELTPQIKVLRSHLRRKNTTKRKKKTKTEAGED